MLTSFPNLLTLSRIAVIPLIIATFYIESHIGNWIGLAVLVYAGVTDFFDGYLARVLAQQTALGKFLDPIADKLLVGSLLVMLVAFDRIPGLAILPAIVILCREILVSGLREFLAGVEISMPVSRLSQWKTTLQMIMLGFLLVGPAGPMFGNFSTTEIGVIGLWIAAILTLITGYDYLRAGLRYVEVIDARDIKSKTSRAKTTSGDIV